jgi:hypothetical protein
VPATLGGQESRVVNRKYTEPQPVIVDAHYSAQFYAELWGMSPSTAVRWFQDLEGVVKLSKPSKNGKRTRVELRIPFSLAMRVYREHDRGGLE